MNKVLHILFLGEDDKGVDSLSQIIEGFGYDVLAGFTNYTKGFLRFFDHSKWDLVICTAASSAIIIKELLPLVQDFITDVPWLAICEKVNREEILAAYDAGCREVLAPKEIHRLGLIVYRLLKEQEECGKIRQEFNSIAREKNKLTTILANIGDGVITTNAQEEIVMMNKGAEEITGWNSSYALSKHLSEIFNIKDKNSGHSLYSLIANSMAKGKSRGLIKDTVLITKDGQEKYLSASISPIKILAEVVGLVIAFRDITKVRTTEKELASEQETLQLLCTALPIGIILIDDHGIVRKVNEAALQVIDSNVDTIRNFHIGSGLKCDHESHNGFIGSLGCIMCELEKIYLENRNLQGEKQTTDTEIFFTFPNGARQKSMWLKVSSANLTINGEPHVLLALDDVTKLKIAEESLQIYQLLSDHAKDSILFFDDEGRVIEANDAALKTFGYKADEILTLGVVELFPRMDPSKVLTNPLYWSQFGEYHETIALKKGGQIFFVEVSVQTANLAGRKVFLSIQRDISERKRVALELELARKSAEEANLAKSEFLANMSHEIRTPLNGMLGMIDLTLLTELNQEQKENLAMAKACAASLLNLINEILDFSKIEARKVTLEHLDFNMIKVIEEVARPHMVKANEKGLAFNKNLALDLPQVVKGDPNRLKQILNNLLSNALKFTDTGSVSMSVELLEEKKEKLELKFTVADTGIGIAVEDLEKIFGTFNQADNSITRRFGGSGLGLTISKQLVELMGGKLWVESEKDLGSKFSFTLLLEASTGETLESELVEAIEKSAEPFKILLAEDEEVNRMVVTRMLKEAGHEVMTASNGLEVLSLIAEEKFDLIMMDIQMPQMDGIETVKRIRQLELERETNLPIIALTAHALEGDREKYMALGMDGYIAKPFQINSMLKTIEEVVKSVRQQERTKDQKSLEEYYALLAKKDIVPQEEKVTENQLLRLDEALTKIKEVCKTKDYETIERWANIIKGLVSRAGLIDLRQAIFKVELAARREDSDLINENLELFIKAASDLYPAKTIPTGVDNEDEDINS